jgi:serine/threonine protein kinase
MNPDTPSSSDARRERRLDEIATAYLKAVEAGEHPDPKEWLARYPDLADDLSAFFAGQRQVAALAGTDTIGLERSAESTLGTVRYIGDYELLEEIARGGMGVVYKARQISLKRLVALKMILAGEYAGAQELARFRKEGEAVASLQDPHIVQIYEVGEHEGHPYFSLEFCAGGSLARKLDGTPLQAQQAVEMVETLARAIHVAHQAGIVHRDLKPANVLLTADGTLKITDFGLAKKLDDSTGQTVSGAIMGTPSYMAPEQASGKGKAVGPAADVYALGAILYELLTGRPPFRAATALETLSQVVNDDPVSPSQFQSKTPRDLVTICLKCLEKEPAKRYASALTLAEDLRRFSAGEPILARRTRLPEKLVKWVRRNRIVAALLTALLVVMTASTLIVSWSVGRKTVEALLPEKQKFTGESPPTPESFFYPGAESRSRSEWGGGVVNNVHFGSNGKTFVLTTPDSYNKVAAFYGEKTRQKVDLDKWPYGSGVSGGNNFEYGKKWDWWTNVLERDEDIPGKVGAKRPIRNHAMLLRTPFYSLTVFLSRADNEDLTHIMLCYEVHKPND